MPSDHKYNLYCAHAFGTKHHGTLQVKKVRVIQTDYQGQIAQSEYKSPSQLA